MFQERQTYMHKNLTKYYEIRFIYPNSDQIGLILYNSKTDQIKPTVISLRFFESMVKDGTIARDL